MVRLDCRMEYKSHIQYVELLRSSYYVMKLSSEILCMIEELISRKSTYYLCDALGRWSFATAIERIWYIAYE